MVLFFTAVHPFSTDFLCIRDLQKAVPHSVYMICKRNISSDHTSHSKQKDRSSQHLHCKYGISDQHLVFFLLAYILQYSHCNTSKEKHQAYPHYHPIDILQILSQKKWNLTEYQTYYFRYNTCNKNKRKVTFTKPTGSLIGCTA